MIGWMKNGRGRKDQSWRNMLRGISFDKLFTIANEFWLIFSLCSWIIIYHAMVKRGFVSEKF